MAIFKILIEIENIARTTNNKKVVCTKLMPNKAKAKKINEYSNNSLLLNFEINQPEVTVPIRAAIGITNNILPS